MQSAVPIRGLLRICMLRNKWDDTSFFILTARDQYQPETRFWFLFLELNKDISNTF
jgi:hypothetical protein